MTLIHNSLPLNNRLTLSLASQHMEFSTQTFQWKNFCLNKEVAKHLQQNTGPPSPLISQPAPGQPADGARAEVLREGRCQPAQRQRATSRPVPYEAKRGRTTSTRADLGQSQLPPSVCIILLRQQMPLQGFSATLPKWQIQQKASPVLLQPLLSPPTTTGSRRDSVAPHNTA